MRQWDSERTDAASIFSWSACAAVKPGAAAMRDYDFEKPRADIDVDVKKPKTSHRRDKLAEVYEYPGHYTEVEAGNKRLSTRLEELQTSFDTKEAVTDASGLSAGTLFTLEAHKRKSENQEYLVTSAALQADSGVFESGDRAHLEFQVDLHCIPSKQPFRPARRTPCPVVPGAQTATVVGHKEGEITTDEYGRVKVHFAWNRARRADKAADPPDEKCSVWVRVAQSWTGSGWGALFIPRVGQEVVVEFLDGNPDRPLVTGCVYNKRNKPPYSLPAKASQSGWKTRSLNQGAADEYNELRFDDDKGHEEIVIQAQRDMKTTVKNNETHRVGGKRTVTVVKGDHMIDVNEGVMTVTVHEAAHTLQAKNAYEIAHEKIAMSIRGTTVEISLTADAIKLGIMSSSIELTAQGIEIKAGANSISLSPAGIDIKGLPQIKLNS
jgi:type VI secretion system secreted protein VgrG